ncbi:MAG: hypothetical protein QOG56_1003 [Solirubrobacteraceae bacterium]|jgi:hypothetical protein|nr:hypothetical protein [Solirubrobacteraceae bacterium]
MAALDDATPDLHDFARALDRAAATHTLDEYEASARRLGPMTLGSLGICSCGYIAVARCEGCGTLLCDTHATQLPEPPSGLSDNAMIKFAGAVRLMGGHACVACREERGRHAISEAIGAPRAPLPDHWLDRAIALQSDQTRSEEERNFDGQLPPTLTAADVAAEFLRRMDKEPREYVAVTESTWLHKPDFAYGWRVECRRTQYVHRWPGGATERYPLPLLISQASELLGPSLEEDESQSATWYIVPESDVDLPKMVAGVAGLLILSPFEA